MKKTVSILLVLVMLLSCASVLAESADVNEEQQEGTDQPTVEAAPGEELEEKSDNTLEMLGDVEVTLPVTQAFGLEPKENAFDAASTDVVSVSGSLNIVKTAENVIFILDVPSGYTCLTQDIEASIFAYFRFKDPDALNKQMIENGIHLLLVDDMTNDWISIVTIGTDAIAARVGNLNSLTTERVEAYAAAFGASQDAVFNDIITTGSTVWMRFNEKILVSVVGGQYILARWAEEEFTEDNLADMTELLTKLIVIG